MMDLSDSERISTIRSAVLIQYTRVTDGRTELAWHIRARYSIHAVARKDQINVNGCYQYTSCVYVHVP